MPANVYAGQRTAGLVRTIFFLIAAVSLVVGPAYWINGLTQPLVRVDGPLAHGIRIALPADQQLGGVSVDVPQGSAARITLFDAGSATSGVHLRPATKLLWRSDSLVLGLTVAAAALLLGLLARDVRAGRPFAPGNARRIALVAACIAFGAIVPPFLHVVSLASAVGDAGLVADQPLVLGYSLHLAPIFGAMAVLVLAQAFRQGARVTQDVEGLV